MDLWQPGSGKHVQTRDTPTLFLWLLRCVWLTIPWSSRAKSHDDTPPLTWSPRRKRLVQSWYLYSGSERKRRPAPKPLPVPSSSEINLRTRPLLDGFRKGSEDIAVPCWGHTVSYSTPSYSTALRFITEYRCMQHCRGSKHHCTNRAQFSILVMAGFVLFVLIHRPQDWKGLKAHV